MLGSAVDAEDATQESFLRAYRALRTFRPDASFAPWIYRIATNVCLDMLRARRPAISTDESPIDPPAHVSVEGAVVERERLQASPRPSSSFPPAYGLFFCGMKQN
jgi:RNA polymerase sigma-70 factor (ECF subfamily)